MSLPIVPVMFILIAGKVVAINYEVYRNVKRRSLDRVNTIDLIDAQIAELSEALAGSAAQHAQVEIERLVDLKTKIEAMHDAERYTVDDYLEDFGDATEEAVEDARVFMNRMYDTVSRRFAEFQDWVDESLDIPGDPDEREKKPEEKEKEES